MIERAVHVESSKRNVAFKPLQTLAVLASKAIERNG
jgi:hypothetical protein